MIKSWKVYILAIISFLVGTSEFVIAGILDLVSKDVGVTIAAAANSFRFTPYLTQWVLRFSLRLPPN